MTAPRRSSRTVILACCAGLAAVVLISIRQKLGAEAFVHAARQAPARLDDISEKVRSPTPEPR